MSNWTAKCSSRNWAVLRRRKLSQNYITQAYKYHALKMAKTATHTLPWGLTNTHTSTYIHNSSLALLQLCRLSILLIISAQEQIPDLRWVRPFPETQLLAGLDFSSHKAPPARGNLWVSFRLFKSTGPCTRGSHDTTEVQMITAGPGEMMNGSPNFYGAFLPLGFSVPASKTRLYSHAFPCP